MVNVLCCGSRPKKNKSKDKENLTETELANPIEPIELVTVIKKELGKWEKIHKDFCKEHLVYAGKRCSNSAHYFWGTSTCSGCEPYYKSSGKTYQQRWEEKGLTYQDAREWIPVGFELDDFSSVKE